MNRFSFFNRENTINELKSSEFDLLVVGGGITGAGIALDAASRGMKVALVEKNDFASGTSSKSTKLIHGGLRYLKQFDFWLVKEVGMERAIVHKLAPHLVVPEKMILPLVDGGTYGSWLTSVGLKVYDVLAAVEGEDKRKMLDQKEALIKEPLLPKDILKGAGYYAEYRTDDARLTLELIKTALNYDAKPINYSEVLEFIYEEKRIVGATVKDVLANTIFNIKSKYVINATGPWVDSLRLKNQINTNKKLRLSKGVHLVVNFDKLPVKQSVYFDIPDGRMMFAIPRGKSTYFGTTDTNYQGNKDEVKTDLVDAMYLIAAVNNMFPDVSISIDDIKSSWAGLRPLIHEEGKPASELSRKDEIFVAKSELISIAGGKLTGYRKMADRVLTAVSKQLPPEQKSKLKRSFTKKILLVTPAIKTSKEVVAYQDELKGQLAEMEITDPYMSWYLCTTYGKNADLILDKKRTFKEGSAQEQLIRAELWYCIQHEMTNGLADFFVRRTARLYFDIDSVTQFMEIILHDCIQYLDWDEKRVALEQKTITELIQDATVYYDKEFE